MSFAVVLAETLAAQEETRVVDAAVLSPESWKSSNSRQSILAN